MILFGNDFVVIRQCLMKDPLSQAGLWHQAEPKLSSPGLPFPNATLGCGWMRAGSGARPWLAARSGRWVPGGPWVGRAGG